MRRKLATFAWNGSGDFENQVSHFTADGTAAMGVVGLDPRLLGPSLKELLSDEIRHLFFLSAAAGNGQ